jgi:hypothetical protein
MKFLKWLKSFFAMREQTSDLTILRGDGTWPWSAHVDGNDILVIGVTATCFGGSKDPDDSGETASGISTKDNPTLKACALPMIYTGTNKALLKALGGSPLPKVPWNTPVEIMSNGKRLVVPVIDLGPAKRTGDAIDLTIAAARYFKSNASATNFLLECSYRIIGGAKYLKGKGSVA